MHKIDTTIVINRRPDTALGCLLFQSDITKSDKVNGPPQLARGHLLSIQAYHTHKSYEHLSRGRNISIMILLETLQGITREPDLKPTRSPHWTLASKTQPSVMYTCTNTRHLLWAQDMPCKHKTCVASTRRVLRLRDKASDNFVYVCLMFNPWT